MWKCVFDSTSKRGVAFNREPQDGEFMQEITPANAAWFASEPERYQYVDGVFSEVSPEIWDEELKGRARRANAGKAAAKVEETLTTLAKNEMRKSAGLPAIMDPASEQALKDYAKVVQGSVDVPSDDVAWNPPLPPGVTPPAYKSVTIEVTRVAGWQGNMGWRAVIKSKTEDFVPTNLAISIHTGANCTGYKYTTGAFQYDAGKKEYFAVCPPGQEPGNNAEHFGLLYGAAQLACFTLAQGENKKIVYAYN